MTQKLPQVKGTLPSARSCFSCTLRVVLKNPRNNDYTVVLRRREKKKINLSQQIKNKRNNSSAGDDRHFGVCCAG